MTLYFLNLVQFDPFKQLFSSLGHEFEFLD